MEDIKKSLRRILYLASHTAYHKGYNITYQDITGKRDIGGDMMDVDLNDYDILIATPPCNYYSRANYRRETSEYSQKTKDLLPDIIKKFELTGKPFIVENVINKPLMQDIINNLDGNTHYYEHGRHSYFTNIMINLNHVEQVRIVNNIKHLSSADRQGGHNVKVVLNYWIDKVLTI